MQTAKDVTAEFEALAAPLKPIVPPEDSRAHVGLIVDEDGRRSTLVAGAAPNPGIARVAEAASLGAVDLGGGAYALGGEIGSNALADLVDLYGGVCIDCMQHRHCHVLEVAGRKLAPRGWQVHDMYWKPGQSGEPEPGSPGSIENVIKLDAPKPEEPRLPGRRTLRQVAAELRRFALLLEDVAGPKEE